MELNERMKKCPWWYKKSEHNKEFKIVEYVVIRNTKIARDIIQFYFWVNVKNT